MGTSRVGRKSTTTKESAKSHTDGQEKGATDGMFDMIMSQIHTMEMDQEEARETDRAEMRRAIKEINTKLEAPILSDDEGAVEEAPEQDMQELSFAAPVKRKNSSRVVSADPVARLRADKASNAQAQLLLGTKGARKIQDDDVEIRSGYYRTLAV